MKRLFVSVFVALCCCLSASAVPAWPGKVTYTQPDGTTIVIQKHGDEFYHWVTDVNGVIVEKDELGYYRPVEKAAHQARLAAGQLRSRAMNAMRTAATRSGEASGTKHFPVILVAFKDVPFTYTKTDYENLLNGTGSAQQFYYDNSGGTFTPVFDVYGPVTLNKNVAEYGAHSGNDNDKDAAGALVDACNMLSAADKSNFSDYDYDNDGKVDVTFMFFAGYGEADYYGSDDEDRIWPHQWNLTSAGKSLTIDGKSIYSYICTNELIGHGENMGNLVGIGTTCHEFGHAMGLPDFYDTNYENDGKSGALYSYSTMSSGNYNNDGHTPPYFNIEERILLGWITAASIPEITSSGSYTLESVNSNVAYKTRTDKNGEYFMYECRTQTGWDSYIPEPGLIVYHIDKSNRTVSVKGYNVQAQSLWSNWGHYNAINANGSHPCFYVVPAGAQSNLNYSGSKFAFPGAAQQYTFTGKSWNGVASNVKLSNIAYSASSGTVSFYASVPSQNLDYNVIKNPGNGTYAVGDTFSLELVESAAQPVESVAWYFDDEPVNTSVTLTAGTHVVEAHLTLVSGEEKIVELTLNVQ